MKYILENTLTNLYGEEHIKSYLIEENKVIYTSNYFSKYKYMRLNTNQFVLAPGFSMIDFSILSISHFHSFKERMKFLKSLGCTTLITAFDVIVESQFQTQLKKAKHSLINSSIDYLLGVKISLSKLTPTMIRKCCKHKVPLLFAEINNLEDIDAIRWQWIRNELFPYHVMIVPIWNVSVSKYKLRKFQSIWEDILTENKIITQADCPKEHTPLSKQFLLDIGLYPTKGSLQVGTDADYLLFSKKEVLLKKNQLHQIQPDVVFANGKVKKAGKKFFLKPGSGKELIVKIPRKFNPISNAFQPPTISIDYY